MSVVIVGAGPTGLFTAIALARRGRRVTVVDRDPGPPVSGPWRRRGVMQFHHAHSFRGHVVDALAAEMPDVLRVLRSEGAGVVSTPAGRPAALHCRRSVVERALRRCAAAEPLVRLHTGHVDEVVAHRGRAIGVRVDGRTVDADVVIDASGRASRIARTSRGDGADCGAAYAGRLYRLRDGAHEGPTNSVVGLSLSFPEYAAVVFRHDRGTFTVTLIHAGTDKRWHRLRDRGAFDAAVRTIPAVADWIDPQRCEPLAPVLVGGRLRNIYRGQLDYSGRPLLPGLVSVGDAVCTTTPLAGRGVTLGLLQARRLVALLEEHSDSVDVTTAFDDWCTRHIRPWFVDHLYADAERVRRWSGHDIALDRPLPSDLIVTAADADSRLTPIVGPYVTMDALPDSLAPAERRAREIYAGGWRPTPPPGPTGDDLIAAASTTPAVA